MKACLLTMYFLVPELLLRVLNQSRLCFQPSLVSQIVLDVREEAYLFLALSDSLSSETCIHSINC